MRFSVHCVHVSVQAPAPRLVLGESCDQLNVSLRRPELLTLKKPIGAWTTRRLASKRRVPCECRQVCNLLPRSPLHEYGHFMNRQNVVLVVEDEPIIRLDLIDMLERAGFGTLEAGSAAEAIALLERRPEIRVVFTDVQMPGTMDGLALAKYVRERWPPTIIVVSSGKVEFQPGELPDDIPTLAKPYDQGRLERVMADIGARLQ